MLITFYKNNLMLLGNRVTKATGGNERRMSYQK